MVQLLRLTENNRSKGFTRADLRQDVLYGYCRLREVSVSISRKERLATRVTDGIANQMLAWGLITQAQKENYEQILLKDLLHMDRFDHYPSEELYAHISTVRQSALGSLCHGRLSAATGTGRVLLFPRRYRSADKEGCLVGKLSCPDLLSDRGAVYAPYAGRYPKGNKKRGLGTV